jgi:hypothetical protein
MRKHQRLNTYNTERANAAAVRKAQAAPVALTLAATFWGEYYRLTSARVTDKTPQFSAEVLDEIACRLLLTEDAVLAMIAKMLEEGITHRHPQGEYIKAILSDGIKVTA